MEIYSKIDSDRFGIKVGKITELFFENKRSVRDGIKYFIENNFELILARIDFNRIDIINGLEKCGFIIKDAQTTLVYDLNNSSIISIPKENLFNVREFKLSDIDALVNITTMSFNKYGHYSADERLNSKDCLDAYIDWVHNSCINDKVADKIFVAELNNEIIGYLSFKTNVFANKKYAAGVMGAVNPDFRNKGVFQSIAVAGLEWGLINGYDWEEHNVLVNNFPVNKSFTKLGFKPNKFMITLHGWMDEVKI
jgi:hypothetical protein